MVRRHHEEGLYDALVVDAAPTGETLRLLSLPDQMGWYVEKFFPVQRNAAKLVRPFARRAKVKSLPPLPEDSFFGALQRFYDAVAGVGEVLTDPEQTSVRLVTNAEKMVVAESRRAYTYLNLYDYAVDAVVVNRLLPDSVSDPYFEKWQVAQARHLESIEEASSPLPILKARLFEREMYGIEALRALAEEIFGGDDPLRRFSIGAAHDIVKTADGYEVILNLPLLEKGSVDLSKKGAELLVRVGGYRRNVLLPDSMVRLRAVGRAWTATSFGSGSRMTEGKRERRAPILGVLAYLLVSGERRRRATGHFRRAGFEVLKGVGELARADGRCGGPGADTERRESIDIEEIRTLRGGF